VSIKCPLGIEKKLPDLARALTRGLRMRGQERAHRRGFLHQDAGFHTSCFERPRNDVLATHTA
jgi:hypothetical protein